jgi:tryptophan-rich sensory protein
MVAGSLMERSKFKWKTFLLCIIIPLGAGLLSVLLNISAFSSYKKLTLPPLSPPGQVFSIVWSVLYLLMGISCYLIVTATAERERRMDALFTYGIQLFVNILWPVLFFNLKAYLLAFVWLIYLWVLVLRMIFQFHHIRCLAAYLQVPYLLWCIFAAYLNLSVYLLNP